MCADFSVISLDANIGDTATPVYSALGGANTEWRWSDTNAGGTSTTASAAWPAMIRPGAVQIVPSATRLRPMQWGRASIAARVRKA